MRVDPRAKPWYAGSSLARATAGMPPHLTVYQVMPPEGQGGRRTGHPMVYWSACSLCDGEIAILFETTGDTGS